MEVNLARRLLRKPAVRDKTGLSDSQTFRLEQKGLFPARVLLGPNAVGWFEDEVDEWIENRPRARGAAPPLPKARRQVAELPDDEARTRDVKPG
jgi:prophage regulatory protein